MKYSIIFKLGVAIMEPLYPTAAKPAERPSSNVKMLHPAQMAAFGKVTIWDGRQSKGRLGQVAFVIFQINGAHFLALGFYATMNFAECPLACSKADFSLALKFP